MPASRNLGLDLARGLCAIGVAVYHFLNWHYDITVRSLGTFGVYTFFVLSAVAMMIRYATDFSGDISVGNAREFFRNRASRILPLLAFVSLFSLCYRSGSFVIPSLDSWTVRAFLTGSGLFALHMPGQISTVPGAWSLGIEAVFYLLFPVACMFAMQSSALALSVLLCSAIVAQQLLLSQLPDVASPQFWGQYIMPLTFAPFFIAGMLIYRCRNLSGKMLFPAGFALLATSLLFSTVSSAELFKAGPAHIALIFGCSVSVALLYWCELPRLLRPFAKFAGEISYSLYLSHWFAFDLAKRTSCVGPTFAVLALALACLLTYGLERPARRLISASARRTAPR